MSKNYINVCIPFREKERIGGGGSFRQNLKLYLDSISYSYEIKPKKARVLFFNVEFPEKEIVSFKKRGGKIVQRLDGVYYPSKHGDQYEARNHALKNIYVHHADLIVFQSEYSRQQCFEMLGPKKEEEYVIIRNGVNKDIFHPNDRQMISAPTGHIRFVTTGHFRNIDMLEPVIKALDILKGRFDFELIIIGPVTSDHAKAYLERDYVSHHAEMSLREVASVLRESHIFIYSHLNPPCPNSVIEAVSCGLPVVGFNSGSMQELLHFSKDLLVDVSEETLQKYEDFDSSKLADVIEKAIEGYPSYQAEAIKNSDLYPFSECGKAYCDVFNMVLQTCGSSPRLTKVSILSKMIQLLRR